MKKLLALLYAFLFCTAPVFAQYYPAGGSGGTPGGSAGQVQYNNSGAFGGFTVGGDATLNSGTGALTVTKTSGVSFATSATTDATNASNISSGTLNNARITSLQSSTTVTTQAAGDNSTKIASTAYVATALAVPSVNDFRLCGTSGAPVGDTASTTSVYLTPYKGKHISLYSGSGSVWVDDISAEIAIPLGTLTSGLPYAVYIYDVAGTATAELQAWTNGTTRATALVMQDGVLCKTGALTRRWVGDFYTASTTTTKDTTGSRYIFNAVNRVKRQLKGFDPAGSYTYSTATARAADGNTTEGQQRVGFLVGLAEEDVSMNYLATVSSGASQMQVGIGLNSTTAAAADSVSTFVYSATQGGVEAQYLGVPAVGFNYLQAIEYVSGGTNVTVYPVNGLYFNAQTSGMTGELRD